MIVPKKFANAKVPVIPDFIRLAKIGGRCYTAEENRRIYNACVEAAKFMEKYEHTPDAPKK